MLSACKVLRKCPSSLAFKGSWFQWPGRFHNAKLVTDGPICTWTQVQQDPGVRKAEVSEFRMRQNLSLLLLSVCDLGEITSLANFLICLKKKFIEL
jgi:hypothetical protein